jgi:hypothetical protein
MSIISRTNFRNRKESIFEPRPYNYKKKIIDRNSNCIIQHEKKNTYDLFKIYLLNIIKSICIIFSLVQIFIAGLNIISNNAYSNYKNLSNFVAFIYGSYISVLHFLENYFY